MGIEAESIVKVGTTEIRDGGSGVSLVTNASVRDSARLRAIIPHWFRVLGDEIAEVAVLLDSRVPEGRIGRLQQGNGSLNEVIEVLTSLAKTYDRFRWRQLDYSTLKEVSKVWWRRGRPVRCQDGTPVFAFAAAVMEAKCRYILRVDCDILFRNSGWVVEAVQQLASDRTDIVTPPRLGLSPTRFSSRAAMFDWPVFRSRFLPMRAARLDVFRCVHRKLHGRSTHLSYEDSIMQAIVRGEIRHCILPEVLGGSLHVVRAADPALPGFSQVVSAWERDEIPAPQIAAGWDFDRSFWTIPQG